MKESVLKKFVQLFFIFSGAILGWLYIPDLFSYFNINAIPFVIVPYLGALLGGLIAFLATFWLADYIVGLIKRVEESLMKVPIADLMFGTIGLVLGLMVAFLITVSLSGIDILIVSDVLPIFITILAGYWGFQVGFKKRDELISLFSISKGKRKENEDGKQANANPIKILDTSVIIDGRIADICQTGFLEGTLVIPQFVLEELQHIADSSDSLKRNRGRRGLDILNKIQKELDVNVEIYEVDFEDVHEVDSKLVKLAKMLDGVVVTNDFNLNKVCELQNVPVLNINDLANAVKPVVLPGEELSIQVIKDGKEHNQGIGYLDDGTMIVVEDGRNYIGKSLDVVVTSVLQTSAGRMIFAKPKLMEKAL